MPSVGSQAVERYRKGHMEYFSKTLKRLSNCFVSFLKLKTFHPRTIYFTAAEIM